ncbi:general substrate transporter [Macrolepiota fuliginosa MF-IS2]|uniref:General substrate transporter n=1 Tax=Macrolepiota fuliginosa MF-IS2 TaxID=1400762 RepID=A0A9P6C2M5_9AGAR|nr:general substrate transporter [Macrolepiota fuliginosa MF-IS2]
MVFQNQVQGISGFRNAYLLAASASLGSVFYGWDIGLIGGVLALESFQEYFGLDKKTAAERADLNGNIVSVLQAGCFFGALGTGYIASKFGRKPSLITSGVIYLIGSLIQSIVGLGSTPEIGLRVLYFSRFLGGVGVGMVSALVPSYVSECTPRSIRGRCTGMVQLANNIGIMLSYWVNYSASKDIPFGEMQWRIPFVMQLVPGILFIIAMLFQPESPRWLVEHEQYDKAAVVLARTTGKDLEDPTVIATLEEIKQEFAGKEKLSILQQVRKMGESRSIALRCFIPSLVMFFQQWTGTNAINYFSPQIFAGLGISGTTAQLFATGVYGVVKVISVAIVLAVAVEGFGRKRCLIVGGLGQGAMMLWIGGYSGIHPSGKTVPASYVSIVAVYLYAVFYCVGWGPLPWVVAGEVSPNHVRPAALSIAVGVNWLFSFTISKLTPIMLNSIKYGTFLIFGFCCLFMALWAYACLLETTGYALEEIKYLFERDVIIRSLQDAPGGKLFLGGKQVPSVESLRKEHERSTGGEVGTGAEDSDLVRISSRDSSAKNSTSV